MGHKQSAMDLLNANPVGGLKTVTSFIKVKPQHENHPLSRIIAENSCQAQPSRNSRNLIGATKMSLTYELQWPRFGGLPMFQNIS